MTTFLNTERFIEKGINNFCKIYGVILEREKFNIIKSETILMEYFEGVKVSKEEDFEKVSQLLDKIYENGSYHGDCNPGNFLIDKNGKVKVLDTQLKKMGFGNFRQHFDTFVLMKYYRPKVYRYKKNIFYYIAFLIRKYRDIRNELRRK